MSTKVHSVSTEEPSYVSKPFVSPFSLALSHSQGLVPRKGTF